MEACIDYFNKQRQWIKDQKHNLDNYDEVTKLTQLCISSVTLRNLKISLFAFLNYAKDVLKQHSVLKCMPYLHNISSTLETQNSYFRTTKAEASIMLGKCIVASNIKNSNKLITSSSHSSEHSEENNKNLHNYNFDFTAGSKSREAWLQNIIKKVKQM